MIRSRSQRAALRLSVGLPTTSTTALSSGYGDPPRNGYYVTFPITIVNTGRVPIAVRRLDFWVATPGVPRTTTDRGNAPFSGSTRQLDSTELGPRQRLANNLTFDVAQPRGTLFYGSAGRPQLAWTFG